MAPLAIFLLVLHFLMFNLFVILYEEPALRRKFGESYERYCRRVGRWLARLTPYSES
jgi:protein-S-isoprenylcysteine O-methyltransferase Ste14